MEKNNYLKSLVLFLILLLPTIVSAYDFENDGIYYNINGNEATVTYKDMVEYNGSYSGQVNIPTTVTHNGTSYPVTSIGDGAFGGCSGLTNIDIPNSVTSIGDYAIMECDGLTNIVIPNSVTNIGKQPFSGCNELVSVVLSNSVTNISYYAFWSCFKLTNIVIPNSITNIDEGAFCDCCGLTDIEIPNSVTSIADYAFCGCDSLTNIYCYATNPPVCAENTFNTYSVILHVPAASLAAYFTAPYWCNFEYIIGDAVVPTSITISNDSAIFQLGEQLMLTATVSPENSSNHVVDWYSTNTTVAVVDNGTVTAIGLGECDILATCSGMQAVCHITVSNPLILDQQEAMLLPNHMLTLTPSAPVMPSIFTVTSSDPTVAAARVMNGKVQVVGIKEGTTTITVASSDGTAQPATCLVTVYTELGDLNSDGFVDISDVTSIIDYLLGGDETSVTTKNADVNGDGIIDISDVTSLINELLNETE